MSLPSSKGLLRVKGQSVEANVLKRGAPRVLHKGSGHRVGGEASTGGASGGGRGKRELSAVPPIDSIVVHYDDDHGQAVPACCGHFRNGMNAPP